MIGKSSGMLGSVYNGDQCVASGFQGFVFPEPLICLVTCRAAERMSGDRGGGDGMACLDLNPSTFDLYKICMIPVKKSLCTKGTHLNGN
jgi:hypothetical protein